YRVAGWKSKPRSRSIHFKLGDRLHLINDLHIAIEAMPRIDPGQSRAQGNFDHLPAAFGHRRGRIWATRRQLLTGCEASRHITEIRGCFGMRMRLRSWIRAHAQAL